MKTVKIPVPLWRRLAMNEFTPRPVFMEVMKNRYGLVRAIDVNTIRATDLGFVPYNIEDEQKYTVFLLTWGEYL